jgi:hypothetical protein
MPKASGQLSSVKGFRNRLSSAITAIARSEIPVVVSRMTVLRPKVSMCRCEGSRSPHELSFTRVCSGERP